jgi:hypothetical protein
VKEQPLKGVALIVFSSLFTTTPINPIPTIGPSILVGWRRVYGIFGIFKQVNSKR